MRYRVEFDGYIIRSDTKERVSDHDELQRILDRILLELSKLAAVDPKLESPEPDSGNIVVSVCVEDDTFFMASIAGSALIRTAVHAAGIGTPGWTVEWVRAVTETPTQTDPHASEEAFA